MHFAGPPPHDLETSTLRFSHLNPPDAFDPDSFSITHPYVSLSSTSRAPAKSASSALPLSLSLASSRALRPSGSIVPPRSALARPIVTARRLDGLPRNSPTREAQMRRLYDLFRLCTLRRDHERATRALRVFMRSHEFPPNFWFADALKLCSHIAAETERQRLEEEQVNGVEQMPSEAVEEASNQAAAEARVRYMKVIWLRVLSFRPLILPRLVPDLCKLGRYSEAQEELDA
ncbi:hypothetical protein K437DRAFT_16389 [Tilletiaria anomala UBC 951]|uniref:Uncharacterized protein n=1 Tax=Tilletiaria anomala (strain ATCC 24038 / CBS 436.72 / UBC 951) TaxID=1037660 RepID=A0A066WMY9_TILAU|nr:uncharacterized protein K437DRAFT_16389 [Tilletiaria anomala UBC 951]KDN52334.1 hypothetical protein K437DRAFT_16389 [Tilletiaria anomala UBC 951]